MAKKTRCRLKTMLLISVVYCSDTLSRIRSHFHFTSIANAMWTDFKLPYYPLKIKRSSQFELRYRYINLFANFAMLFVLRYKYIYCADLFAKLQLRYVASALNAIRYDNIIFKKHYHSARVRTRFYVTFPKATFIIQFGKK